MRCLFLLSVAKNSITYFNMADNAHKLIKKNRMYNVYI